MIKKGRNLPVKVCTRRKRRSARKCKTGTVRNHTWKFCNQQGNRSRTTKRKEQPQPVENTEEEREEQSEP